MYSDSSFHVDGVELSTILKTIFGVFLAIETMNIRIFFIIRSIQLTKKDKNGQHVDRKALKSMKYDGQKYGEIIEYS